MNNVIKKTFWQALEDAGFSKKSDTWYQRHEEVILVANLQKSDYGEQYYVNLGVWIKAVGDSPFDNVRVDPIFPKENHCHVRLRAVSLDPDRQKYWEDRIFNLEHTGVSDSVRSEQIRWFMETLAIPFLQSLNSLAALRQAKKYGRIGNRTHVLLALRAAEFLDAAESIP